MCKQKEPLIEIRFLLTQEEYPILHPTVSSPLVRMRVCPLCLPVLLAALLMMWHGCIADQEQKCKQDNSCCRSQLHCCCWF